MEVLLKEVFEDDFWIMPQTPQYLECGVPYITSKNIKKGKIDFSNVNYISEEDFQFISKNRPIKEDDILISMIGTLGETAVVKLEDGKFYGQNMFLVRLDKEKVCDRYFLNYFNSNRVKRDLERSQNQSTQRYLKANHIEDLIIPLPSLDEQRFIAQILDLLSDIIKKRQKELEELDNLIKSRFVEMFGDPSTNPMGWIETTIGNECFYIKDGPHKSLPDVGKGNGGHPFISVRNIVNGYIDFSTAKYISDEYYADAIKKCHPEKGDMLYSKGGTTGIAKLIDVDEKFANWVHVAVLKFDKTKLNGIFFENMLNGAYCYEQSQSLTKGIANRDLVLSAMAQIKMYRPPMELQEQFADFVYQVDKLKFEVQKSLDETQILMDSLMQQYFG